MFVKFEKWYESHPHTEKVKIIQRYPYYRSFLHKDIVRIILLEFSRKQGRDVAVWVYLQDLK
jgi:hypothetical protein